jgi:hypothetical protein
LTVHVIDEENSVTLFSQHQVQCKCLVLQIRVGRALEHNVPSDQNHISKLAHPAEPHRTGCVWDAAKLAFETIMSNCLLCTLHVANMG